MKKDFKELIEKHSSFWGTIKKFIFVYNDKKNGITPPLKEAAKNLEIKYNISIEIWGIDKILEIFGLLELSKQTYLVSCYLKIDVLPSVKKADKEKLTKFFMYFNQFYQYLIAENEPLRYSHKIPINIFFTNYYGANVFLLEILENWDKNGSLLFLDKNIGDTYEDFKRHFFRLIEILRNYYYEEEGYLLRLDFREDTTVFHKISNLEENLNIEGSHNIYVNMLNNLSTTLNFLKSDFYKLIEELKKLDFYE